MEDDLRPIFDETVGQFKLSASISADRLKLFVDVEKLDPAAYLHREDILHMLEGHVDLHCVNLGVVDDIVRVLNEGDQSVQVRRVATGQAPKDGIDGKLLILVKKFRGLPEVKVDENGMAHYRELHIFDNVEKGQVVGRLYPPQPGVDGIDVLGRSIPHRSGEPEFVKLDPSLVLESADDPSARYKQIVAREFGFLKQDDAFLKVDPELVVDGDLDFRWGNLDFVGAVKVSGDVLPGFSIKARRGIEVGGSVRGGGLIAAEGPIRVWGHVYGGQKSMIIAGRTFHAKVIQEINTEILGDIFIEKEAIDSTLRTSGALRMPDGALVGGRVFAVRGVEAKILGCEAGTTTTISLSSDVEASMAYARLLVEIEVQVQQIKTLELQLGPLAHQPERLKTLTGTSRSKMIQFYERLRKLKATESMLNEQKRQMVNAAKTSEVLRVNFLSRLYPGVLVKSSGVTFSTNEVLNGPASLDFRISERKFVLGEYKALSST